MTIVAILLLMVISSVCVYYRGRHDGRRAERDRALGLMSDALRQRWSGTLRWVLNAIDNNSHELMDYTEWFGETPEQAKQNENEKRIAENIGRREMDRIARSASPSGKVE